MSSIDPSQLTVLVVDDEAEVLAITTRMVQRVGYRVVSSNRPLDAIELFRAQFSSISCVILDLTMPQMNGIELLRQLRAIQPQLPAILCSGYSEEYTDGQYAQLGISSILAKPFRLDELRTALESLNLSHSA
jgi:two-component system, cell cycle sensor histidine kinase and response regulator CckA